MDAPNATSDIPWVDEPIYYGPTTRIARTRLYRAMVWEATPGQWCARVEVFGEYETARVDYASREDAQAAVPALIRIAAGKIIALLSPLAAPEVLSA